MKKIIAVLGVWLLIFGVLGMADATTYTLDFDGAGDTQATLDTYLQGFFPDARTTNLIGDTETGSGTLLFGGSPYIRTYDPDPTTGGAGANGTIDFEHGPANASKFELLGISFDWGVYRTTSGIDFGLDIFDDATSSWINNYFTINSTTGNNQYTSTYGSSGWISFPIEYEVTRLRIHDGMAHDVGIDNLIVTATPEPATMLLFSLGLLGLAGVRRKLKK